MLCAEDIRSLAFGLPEGIRSLREAGYIDRELAAIDDLLGRDIPQALRTRLTLEREIALRLTRDYTTSYEALLSRLQSRFPACTSDDLDRLIADGRADWRLRDGKIRFQNDCADSLEINALPVLTHGEGRHEPEDDPLGARACAAKMRENGRLALRHRLRHSVWPSDEARQPGARILVHIPMPAETDTQGNLRILDAAPGGFLSDAAQRTLSFDTVDRPGQVYFAEYTFDAVQRYVPFAPEAVCAEQPDAFRGEEYPHIRFTPYLRALAQEIAGTEPNALLRARRIYDFITKRVAYSYMPDYLVIENLPEYAAMNLRGDCGVQALLFITLCRIAGIGAVWQSGLSLRPGRAGSHDWARYYVAPFGWLYADLSCGGDAWREGDAAMHDFYSRCTVPLRMIANNAFGTPFDPPKRYLRIDPFDSQTGEIEYENRGLCAAERRLRRENLGSEPL